MGEGRYIGSCPAEIEILGSRFFVDVHFARVGDRFLCVGLDVRSFYDANNHPLDDDKYHPFRDRVRSTGSSLDIRPINEDWVEVTSPVIRGLRPGEIIEAVQAAMRDLLREMLIKRDLDPDEVVGEALPSKSPAQRGRRRVLSDVTLRDVVAPAYLTGGRKPVLAVRQALADAGEYGGLVTIDNARKAVSAARRFGYIPPAAQGRRDQEDRP